MQMDKAPSRSFTVAETSLLSDVGNIKKQVAPYVHETLDLDNHYRFSGPSMGFVVYDEIKTTDFYARVEVQSDRVFLIMDPLFMAPLFRIDKPDRNQVHYSVYDVKGKTKGETIVVGEKDMWGNDECIIYK